MLKRQLKCELCGTEFECSGISLAGRCWCSDLHIAGTALEELRAVATDCVCPACLADRAKVSDH